MSRGHLTKEDIRLCVDAVKALARERGVERDGAAVAKFMTTAAHHFNRGVRGLEELVAAMKAELT